MQKRLRLTFRNFSKKVQVYLSPFGKNKVKVINPVLKGLKST